MDADALISGLNDSQLQAVTSSGGPLVVLAGAGSGKTRVLTRRIAWRVADGQTDPSRVLALTFTRKAAGELRSRLRANGLRDNVAAGTFHAIALTQLRHRWNDRGIKPPAMLDRKIRVIAQLMGRRARVEPLDVVSEIEWARARLVAPNDYGQAAEQAGRTPPIPPADFAELMERYQQEKRRKRVVDFDDLLALATRDLHNDIDYANAIRWRHRHLYVDEFQDVNPLQFELLQAWRGDSSDLFVVGDPNQAIYGWNGADPGLLTEFARREPGSVVIELNDNYRSTPQVLTMATAALAGKSTALAAHKSDGDVPTLRNYRNDLDEAAGIARRAKDARMVGEPWSNQAVLVRTNAQLVPIEQALIDKGIPVRVRGGTGPLSTKEVKEELRSLTRPGIDVASVLAKLDSTLNEATQEATTAEIERRQNLGALSRLVHEYISIDVDPSGPGLSAWIATVQAGEFDVEGDAIDLSTFHGAKGLEWPIVHVAGLEKGFVPISYAKTGAQLAEEQRLLYVAVTRAEDQLHLSWAEERTFGAKARKRQPSLHLEMLQSAISHLQRGHRPLDWRAKIDFTKSKISSGSSPIKKKSDQNPVNDPLFDALRSWRRDKARAADVPAYIIFSDQTLRAIAKRQPTTRSALAAMPGIGPVKLERYASEVLALVSS